MSYLWQEIHEQPTVLTELIKLEQPRMGTIVRDLHRRDIKFLFIVARGSSDNAGRYGKYLFSTMNRLPVALAAPSLFTCYHLPPCLDNALVIGISQSGQSLEVIEVFEEARRQGVCTLAITNEPDSPIAISAEHVMLCRAGEEHSLAASKTYTAQLTALALLATSMSGDETRLKALKVVPLAVKAALLAEDQIKQAVKRYAKMDRCVVIGRGYNFATAHEIALKLKELTYIAAEPYSSADFRHGPVAIMAKGFPAILIAPQGKVYDDIRELMKELHNRGSDLIVISDRDDALALGKISFRLPIAVEEWLSPIVSVIPGQIFSMHLALEKGLDPDQPRGLKKVTLTK